MERDDLHVGKVSLESSKQNHASSIAANPRMKAGNCSVSLQSAEQSGGPKSVSSRSIYIPNDVGI